MKAIKFASVVSMALLLSLATLSPAIGAGKIAVKLATSFSEDDPGGIAAEHFKKRVEELTNGQVEVKIFPRNTLGAEMAMLENTVAGNIHFAQITNTVLTNLVPTLSMMDLPYIFDNVESAWKVVEGPIGEFLSREILAKGVRPLGWSYAGARCLLFRDKPVKTVEDIAGLKIRVPANPLFSETISSWGANPTTVPWTEAYLALSQGVVDGMETAAGPSYDVKHYEVVKYIVPTNHLMYFHVWLASEKQWERFPTDLQMVFTLAADEAARLQRDLRYKQEKGIYQKFEEQGVEVIQPDVTGFVEKSRSVYGKFQDKASPLAVDILKRAGEK